MKSEQIFQSLSVIVNTVLAILTIFMMPKIIILLIFGIIIIHMAIQMLQMMIEMRRR